MLLVYDPTTNPLNNNEWSFPLFECIHIASFAMSVGTIAIVDLRLMGVGLRHQTAAQLVKDTTLWTMAGLIIVITSGFVIFTSDPLRYFYSTAFRLKIICLLIAIVYNYTIHRKVAMSGATGLTGGLVGAISLLLWVTIAFAGLFYAFT